MRPSTPHSPGGLLKLAEKKDLPEETAALLTILAIRRRQVDQGQLLSAAEVFKRTRGRLTQNPV